MKLSLIGFRLINARNHNRGILNSYRLVIFKLTQFISHSTPRKLLNFILCKSQKWLKRDKVLGMPYRYTIDPVNACNLRCPLCPTGLGILGRERGLIDFENYKEIIDQISPFAYYVELYNWGEPFLHPQIFEIFEYASSKRIAVRISANLNRFNLEMAKKTVSSGLNSLIVSVDGSTQEVYEKYRRKGNLFQVLENITLLVEEKKRTNSKTPFIILRMLVNRHNEKQIASMRVLAEDLGVDAFTTIPIFVDTSDLIQIKEWLPEKEQLSFYDYKSEKLENIWHCADLWESMTINWDGGLAPCCWLHEKSHDYENAFERPLKEIWNGDAYISSRRVFSFGGPKAGPTQTICTVCKGHPQYLKD